MPEASAKVAPVDTQGAIRVLAQGRSGMQGALFSLPVGTTVPPALSRIPGQAAPPTIPSPGGAMRAHGSAREHAPARSVHCAVSTS